MRKRILTALLATIMTIGALTGCSNKDTASGSNKEGGNSAGGDKVNLNVWIMPNTPEPENDFMQVIQPFLDENPDISVTPTILDWGSAWTKLTTAATSGEGPDISQIGSTWVAALGAMGAFEDLSPVYEQFGGTESFLEASLPTTQVAGGSERYGVPWFIDTRALYYRKDICEAAGVNPDTDFETWDSFKEALRKIKALGTYEGKEVIPFGMPGKNDWNVVHNFAPWIWGAGGEFVSEDGKTSEINSKESVEGIKFYTELANEGLLHKGTLEKNSSECDSLFLAGDFAVQFGGAWQVNSLERQQKENDELISNGQTPETEALIDKVGTKILPAGPEGRFCFYGGSSLTVFKSSKNKEASYKLIEFLAQGESQVEYQKIGGNLPAAKSAYEDAWITDNPLRSVFKEQMQYGKSYPSIPGWSPSETLIQKGLSNVWDNVMGVFGDYSAEKTQELMDAAAQECTTLYQQQ